MKYHTIEGKTYCVVGTVEGTVTSASGVVITSFSANEQSYFTAPAGGFVTISDDTAIVTPVFDSAPAVLVGKSGGGSSSSFDMEAYNAFYGKYVTCTNVDGVSAINSDYQNDLTSWGKWIYDLPALTNGRFGFSGCTNLTSFGGDLSALSDANKMFYWCKKLRSFSVDLPKLTSGQWMFQGCENLTSFDGDLSSLTSGLQMFQGCANLTSFRSKLSSLTNGQQMFDDCTKLRSFSVDLHKLTDGSWMFGYCTNLTSWNIDLPALTNGGSMFNRCSKLSSFSVDLPNLTDGTYMFYNCKLDLASVQNIADTINTVSSGTITIGMTSTIQDTADLNTALEAIRAKGWTVEEQYNS